MSSVTRFLRQIPTGLQFYTISAATPATVFYELTPSPAGGNYPNDLGYVALTAASIPDDMPLTGTSYLVRDMGKTVKATVGVPSSTNTTKSFFREVQLVNPAYYTSGGVNVGTSPASTADGGLAAYYTFYVPIAMSGLPLQASVGTPGVVTPVIMTPVAAGIM